MQSQLSCLKLEEERSELEARLAEGVQAYEAQRMQLEAAVSLADAQAACAAHAACHGGYDEA